MAWRELRFACDGPFAEAFSDALVDAGALSVTVEDADAGTPLERAQFGEPGSALAAAWRHSTVVALVDAAIDDKLLVSQTTAALGLAEAPTYTSANVPEQDWVRLTQAQFDPIRISGRLWIVPPGIVRRIQTRFRSGSIRVLRSAPAVIQPRACAWPGLIRMSYRTIRCSTTAVARASSQLRPHGSVRAR